MTNRRTAALLASLTTALALLLLLSCLFCAGCGGENGEGAGETLPGESGAQDGSETGPGEAAKAPETGETADPAVIESELAELALEAALRNNPNLPELEVTGVKVLGSWARVDIIPSDGSIEGASVFFRRDNGQWRVFDFGTGVSPDLYPEAPPGLFE